jgi:hypothetical protein
MVPFLQLYGHDSFGIEGFTELSRDARFFKVKKTPPMGGVLVFW